MNRWCLFTLTMAVVVASTAQASARPTVFPVYERVARADVIFVGKVDSVEDKTVILSDKCEYHIATVKVIDPIFNAKGLTQVRVVIRVTPKPLPSTWAVGQELCLFLSRKPDQDFYAAPLGFDVVTKQAATFEKDVAEAKRCAKLIDDPDAGLKSHDAEVKLLTAAMLLTRYRTVKEGQIRQEPIEPEQSKLILQAIAEADWDEKRDADRPTPQMTFAKLGLLKNMDSWVAPLEPQDFPEAAKKWLNIYGEKHRILKFVDGQ